jgi:cytochrome c5
MVFINYKDNSHLDADGFAPFGQVVTGMDVVDALFSGYGRQNVPDQRRILREGNAYLLAEYPRLDFIRSASIDAQDQSPQEGAPVPRPVAGTTNRSTQAGVYTRAQAERGRREYELRCEQCHGPALGGDVMEEIPALAWDPFFLQWDGRAVEELVERITRSMPPEAPGSTDRQTATDVVS